MIVSFERDKYCSIFKKINFGVYCKINIRNLSLSEITHDIISWKYSGGNDFQMDTGRMLLKRTKIRKYTVAHNPAVGKGTVSYDLIGFFHS